MLLPAIKTKSSKSVLNNEGETVALIVDKGHENPQLLLLFAGNSSKQNVVALNELDGRNQLNTIGLFQ